MNFDALCRLTDEALGGFYSLSAPQKPSEQYARQRSTVGQQMAFYKTPGHQLAASRSKTVDARQSFSSGGADLRIQLDLRPLARALAQVATETQNTAISRALNRAADRDLKPGWKSRLRKLTGIRRVSRINKAMYVNHARKGKLEAAVVVRDRHTRVTRAYYGATYSREYGRPGGNARHGIKYGPAGVTHSAWGRTVTVAHSFMLKGKEPAFIRVRYVNGGHPTLTPRGKREAIVPLFGPSLPREIHRNAAQARKDIEIAVSRTALPEVKRQIDLALKKAKTKNGL